VRQRGLVILNPYVIPRIDPTVARLASKKMISLADVSPVGAFAEYRPAWSRFIDRHDRRHLDPPELPRRSILRVVLWEVSLNLSPWNHGTVLTKNQAPELLRRPDPHGAGYIRQHHKPDGTLYRYQ
jgi:hypothetical protein